MFVRHVRQMLFHFPPVAMKPSLKRFSTHDDCIKITALVIQKLEKTHHLSPLTCLSLDVEILHRYLEKKIKPALTDLSGFPLTYEIEISKELVGLDIKPCTLVLKPETIVSLMRGQLTLGGVMIK